MRRIAFQCSPYGASTMLGVKFILRRDGIDRRQPEVHASPTRCARERERARDVQVSDHGENRAIRIRCLAHESGSGVIVADDDDVHAEELDVHKVTCTESGKPLGNRGGRFERSRKGDDDPRVMVMYGHAYTTQTRLTRTYVRMHAYMRAHARSWWSWGRITYRTPCSTLQMGPRRIRMASRRGYR